jgi:methyl-accepting chemotaxis protein
MKFKWTIRRKLASLIVAGGVFMLAVAATGYWSIINSEHNNEEQMARMDLLRVHLEADMAHDAIRADVLDALLLGVDKDDIGGMASKDYIAREKYIKDGFREHAKSIQDGVAHLANPGHRLSDSVKRTQEDLETYITYAASMIDDGLADSKHARLRLTGFLELFGDLEKRMADVSTEIEQRANEAKKNAGTSAANNKLILAIITLAALVVGLVIAFAVAQSIAGRLSRAVAVAQAVAAGDLTQRIDAIGDDEIGQLMRSFAEMNGALNARISHLANEIHRSSSAILDASNQLVSCSGSLSQRTEMQASTVEETAASIEQISAAVKQNADHAEQAKGRSEVASQIAGKGRETTAKLVATMEKIHARALRIGDIVTLIDGIAFQTNILALNAAVEAARAGEQGRGFAVVATEVRNLAQRSAASAKEVKGLIEGTVLEIEAGGNVADEAGKTANVSVENSRAVMTLMSDIAVASREQSEAVEQMALAIIQIERASEQNADLVQDAGSMADLLARHAAHLMELLSDFKLDDARANQLSRDPPFTVVAQKNRPLRDAIVTHS